MEDALINILEGPERIYNIRHRCFSFSKDVIAFIRLQSIEPLFYSMFDQLLRSTTSIGANVVEGCAGRSDKDFINYHAFALKSANETKYWLCLLRDAIPEISKETLDSLIKEADEISRIIAKIILNVRAKSVK